MPYQKRASDFLQDIAEDLPLVVTDGMLRGNCPTCGEEVNFAESTFTVIAAGATYSCPRDGSEFASIDNDRDTLALNCGALRMAVTPIG